jgi:hypothetical protein
MRLVSDLASQQARPGLNERDDTSQVPSHKLNVVTLNGGAGGAVFKMRAGRPLASRGENRRFRRQPGIEAR